MAASGMSQSGLTISTRQTVKPGPFETAESTTDIVFVVEGRKLHFNKAVLSMCSPVFQRMFTADFREKEAKEIPLPGKEYWNMVEFFQQIHPVYASVTPITGTANLLTAYMMSGPDRLVDFHVRALFLLLRVE